MAKKKIRRRAAGLSANAARTALINTYREKYFNLWMGAWRWRGLDRYQSDYVMRKLWDVGTLAAFDIIRGMTPFMGGLSPAKEGDNGLLGFATYAAQSYNLYGFPAVVQLVNERGTPYVPGGPQVSGEDVAIGWALHSRNPIRLIVDVYIEKIVDVEMTIRTNLIGHKVPFVLECEDERDAQGNDLIRRIMQDEAAFIVRPGQSLPKPASTGQNYIIDKLYNYKVALENELLTFIGIDNIGSIEKKERLITDEANSQNAVIQDASDSIGYNLGTWSDEINAILGYSIYPESTASPRANEEEQAQDAPDMKEEEKEDEEI